VGTFEDATLKLANGDPVLWVALKDHAKNAVQFIDKGKMLFKNLRFLVKALYVESSTEACFHGLRPHVRLTSITPRTICRWGHIGMMASLKIDPDILKKWRWLVGTRGRE